MKRDEFEVISRGMLSRIKQLQRKKERQERRLFTAEGKKCISDLAERFRINCLVGTMAALTCSSDLIGKAGYGNVYSASEADMSKMSSFSTASDIIAVFEYAEDIEVDDLDADGLYLLLDGIQDPGNLGTILRTAWWFGVDAIFASNGTVDIYNPKTVQATMGALGHVRVTYTDLDRLINHNSAIPVVGTYMEGEDLNVTEWPRGCMIVMGNEGQGISKDIGYKVNKRITITPHDIHDKPESLNVGIAAALVLASYRRVYS